MLGSELSRAIFSRFFVTMAIYLVIILLLLAAARSFLIRYVWYASNPYYQIFKWIDNNLYEFIILCGLIGFLAIFSVYWKKTLNYIDTIVEASEALAAKDDALIKLPDELKLVEDRMNLVKQNAARSENIAREAEQRKNDLIVYLAHDLKTPLTSIIGYLSLLDDAPEMPPDQKAKYLRITLEKANRLEQLINEFFEITRYNFQTIVLSKKNIDLSYMLIQLTDEFYPQLSAKGKQANINAPDDLTIFGDPDKLARVFNNLLKNAAAYSPDNSRIEITAENRDGIVTIAFDNEGGIPQEKLDAIFEKFVRLDDSRSSDTGGSGLGLSIAREIVELHGGRIYAQSSDSISRFVVELPS